METSKGIMVTKDYGDAVFYKASCSCAGHESTLILEYDDKINDVVLTIYERMGVAKYYGYEYGFWNRIKGYWKRIKIAFKLITTGCIEMEGAFIFDSKGHIEDYVKALQEGITHIKSEG